MSKARLKSLLRKIDERVAKRDQELRKEGSNKSNHTATFNSVDIRKQIRSFVRSKGHKIDASQNRKIVKAVDEFCVDLYNNFSISKGATTTRFRIFGRPKDFAIVIVKTKGSPRVFDGPLRSSLTPFVGKLESKIIEIFSGDESWSRLNVKTNQNIFNLGHQKGYSIAEQGATLFLRPDEYGLVTKVRNDTIKTTLEKFGLVTNKKEFVRVSLESSSDNQDTSAKEEKGRLKEIVKTIENYLKSIELEEMRGSPSLKEEVQESLYKAAQGKTYNKKIKSSATSVKKTKVEDKAAKFKLDIGGNIAPKKNWASIIPVINSKLEAQVKSNMGEPSLVNRTGAFASSARVTGFTLTGGGFPSFEMDYNKEPYGVFDRKLGASPWATPARDPYTIIEKSIRDILKDMAIGRFYLRRG